ncbi:hypothetical protein P5673_026455 [Acropora cervicornis]|uniref:Uncharacterized protein n=1 Tax=Acropora cervicornis TaxID=6130 RepID=A0AAD9Q098_ACRCE|nr:hypothetical protein P5673_026455 [Acropora cervicornis]
MFTQKRICSLSV